MMAQVRNFECSNFADSARAVVEMSLQIGPTSKNLSVDQIFSRGESWLPTPFLPRTRRRLGLQRSTLDAPAPARGLSSIQLAPSLCDRQALGGTDLHPHIEITPELATERLQVFKL